MNVTLSWALQTIYSSLKNLQIFRAFSSVSGVSIRGSLCCRLALSPSVPPSWSLSCSQDAIEGIRWTRLLAHRSATTLVIHTTSLSAIVLLHLVEESQEEAGPAVLYV